MSASVNVLSPNGRRQNVTVTANKTILQIIEEVCLKQGFNADKYNLKHGRTILDFTTTFRFSGVPNKAKLELVAAEQPRLQSYEVIIALQLDTGERRQQSISSDTTLIDVLRTFQKNDENLWSVREDSRHPVIVHMCDEIIGVEALSSATLKSIGIIAGKAALRLVYRQVSSDVLNSISEKIVQTKHQAEKYTKYAQKQQRLEEQQLEMLLSSHTAMDTDPEKTDNKAELMETVAESTSAMHQESISSSASLTYHLAQDDRNVNSVPVSAANSLEIVQPSSVHTDLAQAQTAVKPKHQTDNRPAVFLPFADFKFPEATSGQNLYHNELSEYSKEDYLPCDREVCVYSLDKTGYNNHQFDSNDLSEDFFDMTKDDLRSMLRGIRKQISEMENAPLLTSSLKQAKLEDSFSKYKCAVIRFHFPDKIVVQAKFRTRETVRALRKFVKEILQISNDEFTLYTTPPKTILGDISDTLILAKLVPLSIVYVGLSKGVGVQSVTDEIMAMVSTKVEADRVATDSLPVLEVDSTVSTMHSKDVGANLIKASPRTASDAGTASAKIPKWYKPGK